MTLHHPGSTHATPGHRLLQLAALALATTVPAGGAFAGPPRYALEVFPPLPGHAAAVPMGMSEDGVIVGYAGPDPFDANSVAVRTSGAVLLELVSGNGSWNRAHDVSEDGIVVGMSLFTPFKWSGGAGGSLPVPAGYFSGRAWGVNGSDVSCGHLINDLIGFDLPCYWPTPTSEGVLLPGLEDAQAGYARAINAAGQMAGAIGVGGPPYLGARWGGPGQTPTVIGTLRGAHNSELYAINGLGDAAGRAAFPNNDVHALLHVIATDELIDLGVLGGVPFSVAHGLNDQRQVVGTSSTAADPHAFLWQDGTLHDLNDLITTSSEPFSYLAGAVEINEAGQIAVEVIVSSEVPSDTHRIGRLTPCASGDVDCDGAVDVTDLLALLAAWGPCPGPPPACAEDANGDGVVNVNDLLTLLANWS